MGLGSCQGLIWIWAVSSLQDHKALLIPEAQVSLEVGSIEH